MRNVFFSFSFLIILYFASCSKDDSEGGDGEFANLSGHLLYQFAGEVKKLDFATGLASVYFTYNTYSFSNWDISRDGAFRLTSEDETGTINSTIFKLIRTSDNEIVEQFSYTPPGGSGTGFSGYLSPDNTMILIKPDLRGNGIVILNTKGELLHQMTGLNDTPLELGDEASWLPDNSLLLTFQGKYILRASPPYTNASVIKEMNYDDWGNLNTNLEGTKISLYIGNHIYTMDIDGSNLNQVTESESVENLGLFSPDGKFLLIGSDYIHAPVSGRSSWKLKIIPNDGNKYHLNDSNEVIPVQPSNENIAPSVSGRNFWMP